MRRSSHSSSLVAGISCVYCAELREAVPADADSILRMLWALVGLSASRY